MSHHDVFISYTHSDQSLVDAIAVTCESQGIRCWYSARDVRAGESYPEAIMTAIKNAKVMIVVLSEAANDSEHVKNELERALHHRIHIIPFRIEKTPQSADVEYLVSRKHWIDALPPPALDHVNRLAARLAEVLGHSSPTPSTTSAGRPRKISGQRRSRRVLGMTALVLAAVSAAVGFKTWESRHSQVSFNDARDIVDGESTIEAGMPESDPGDYTAGSHSATANEGANEGARQVQAEPAEAKLGGAAPSNLPDSPTPSGVGHPVSESALPEEETATDEVSHPDTTSQGTSSDSAIRAPSQDSGSDADWTVREGRLGGDDPSFCSLAYVAPSDGRVRFSVENLVPSGTEHARIENVFLDDRGFGFCDPGMVRKTGWLTIGAERKVDLRIRLGEGQKVKYRAEAEFEAISTSDADDEEVTNRIDDRPVSGYLGFDGTSSDHWTFEAPSDGRVYLRVENLIPNETQLGRISNVFVEDQGFGFCDPGMSRTTQWRTVRKGQHLDIRVTGDASNNVRYSARAVFETLPTANDEEGLDGGQVKARPTIGVLGFDHSSVDHWLFKPQSNGRVRFTVENLIPEDTSCARIGNVSVDDLEFGFCDPGMPRTTQWRSARRDQVVDLRVRGDGNNNVVYRVIAKFEELSTPTEETGADGGPIGTAPVAGMLGFDDSASDCWTLEAESEGQVQFTVENLIPKDTLRSRIKNVFVDDKAFGFCDPASSRSTAWIKTKKGEQLRIRITAQKGDCVSYRIRTSYRE